jgi:hypothetical protein
MEKLIADYEYVVERLEQFLSLLREPDKWDIQKIVTIG